MSCKSAISILRTFTGVSASGWGRDYAKQSMAADGGRNSSALRNGLKNYFAVGAIS
jgi:hypothetical protein